MTGTGIIDYLAVMHSRTPLARWFRATGATVTSVAAALGVSRVSVYHYINARKVPCEPTISRLASLTGLPTSQLNTRKKRPTPKPARKRRARMVCAATAVKIAQLAQETAR